MGRVASRQATIFAIQQQKVLKLCARRLLSTTLMVRIVHFWKSVAAVYISPTSSDFCIWGPPKPDSTIADTEGELVAWCTKPGRGTRIIPSGALTGVQFMQTPDYLQVTGHINQSLINILQGDTGGGEYSP